MVSKMENNLNGFYSSVEVNSERHFKLDILAKLVQKLEVVIADFQESKQELSKLHGGLYTLKELFSEEDNDVSKRIDEIMEEIYRVEYVNTLYSRFVDDRNRKAHNDRGSMLLRPSLSETKEIAFRILRKQKSVHSTSKFREAFYDEGYDVNINSLKTILSQTKDVFKFNPEMGGWTLIENDLDSKKRDDNLVGSCSK